MDRNPSCLVVSTLGFEGGAIGSNPKRSSPQRFKMSRQRVSLHFMPQTQAGGLISTYFHQLRQLGVEHLGLRLSVVYGGGRLL